jgi:DMSO/TMAO reductase YedYZ molybdopterin-dependent catalytic subunit
MQSTKQSSAEYISPPFSIRPSVKLRQFFVHWLLLPLGAGLAASLLTVTLMLMLRVVAGIPTPVELFGDHILKLLDASTFVHLLVRFAPNSKTIPLGLALLGMIGAGTLLGLLYAVIVRVATPVQGKRPGWREWLTALAFAATMTLVGILLFQEELRQNTFGLPVGWATFLSALGLLADFVLYGLTLSLAYRVLLPKQVSPGANIHAQGRRLLLSRASVAALSVGAGAASLGLIKSYLNNYTSYDGSGAPSPAGITAPITPNSEHYVVTQNTVDPMPNISLWRLEVGGLVKRPASHTYEEVQKLPSISRAVTLECIANGTGGHLISTAIWQGVTLRTLLEQHGGVQAGASHVAFYSVDGYTVSLPLGELLRVDTLLAWRMNGVEIPQRHGYPMRVLVPDHYGEENPKWLTRIEVTDHFVGGLYADQGWYNGPLHTISRIDRPTDRVSVGHNVEVGGIAFAGSRGIQKVEVSTDGGVSWHEAKLQPALSQDSWVLWTWQWMPRLAGKYMLVVRATDGTGDLQTEHMQGTVPNGATGYHMVKVMAV